jgi:hypothetical protein
MVCGYEILNRIGNSQSPNKTNWGNCDCLEEPIGRRYWLLSAVFASTDFQGTLPSAAVCQRRPTYFIR